MECQNDTLNKYKRKEAVKTFEIVRMSHLVAANNELEQKTDNLAAMFQTETINNKDPLKLRQIKYLENLQLKFRSHMEVKK